MKAVSEMTDKMAFKGLGVPKSLGAGLSCMGLIATPRWLMVNAIAWKTSFKFVLNASAGMVNGGGIVRIFQGWVNEINSAISMSNLIIKLFLSCLDIALLQRIFSTDPNPIVVNPMLTESA